VFRGKNKQALPRRERRAGSQPLPPTTLSSHPCRSLRYQNAEASATFPAAHIGQATLLSTRLAAARGSPPRKSRHTTTFIDGKSGCPIQSTGRLPLRYVMVRTTSELWSISANSSRSNPCHSCSLRHHSRSLRRAYRGPGGAGSSVAEPPVTEF
jgi:hypothetical protein